ncbi:hypothetical protein C4D60_Mb06t28180 [Musa balbisiana]|uniref:Uncharacterized protein n=1 Tax=Musa balbisiana TaxID=52838 RepID=A0A4S8IRZ4_MUSBA|nr:hypothetical protein C4D60_Mb06t28180 [Musa balbisiana]
MVLRIEVDHFSQKAADVHVRGPTLCHRLDRQLLELLCPLPPALCLLAAPHQLVHRLLYCFSLHECPLFLVDAAHCCSHRNPDPQHVHHQLLVDELLRKQRPGHHRHACAYPFQARVPSAVRHGPSDCLMVQNQQLRRPSPY